MATPSLYRRYRPRRFGELKGQDHVVHALRDAVAKGREGQAYLFSGPRGTGKTSSARILAKVLNCERPVDGEPCCECKPCLAVERGTSYDVHELDAASNNGVDAMRELIERAALGTPGRHKVYILDEVHMLSRPAEAALLKTLEEPPPHVVFVLATTDPQKVSETIRSRTQHLRFHLLAPDELAAHVRWVAADAGLEVSSEAVDAAVAQGAGSVRDALSALELIANAGGAVAEVLSFDELVEALIEHDAGHALTAVAHAVNAGHEPRALAEAFVRYLRNGFLALMAPELVPLSAPQVDTLAAQAQRLGPAALVRAIERLGEILVELRHAPDPRVLVEVALVQLAAPPATSGDDIGALAARVSALEQALATGRVPVATAPAPIDPVTGRTQLGGRARRGADVPAPASSHGPAPGPSANAEPASSPAVGAPVDWDRIKPTLKGMARAVFTPVDLVATAGDAIVLATPNTTHLAKCQEHLATVIRACTEAVGRPVTIELTVKAAAARADPAEPAEEDIDLDDLVDAAPGSLPTALDRLAEAFPGSELVERGD